jgi:tetratricopeptide (TPR) repeat protein
MLLLLDNFESVASMPDESSAAPPLDDVGRTILGDFIRQVAGEENGAVLITSRTPESWLGDLRRIPLAGLPPPEAVQYADRLLSALPSAQPRRGDKAFGELLEWLDGHPLCMRVTLPQLPATGAADILASLRGEAMVGQGEQSGERDRVLSACVSYSASQLDAAERRLLVLVSLFSGAVSTVILAQLCEDDRIPPKFRGIDLDMWDSVLGRAAEVGLLADLGDGWFAVHPALPAFLAEEWEDADPPTFPADRAAVRTGLLGAYAEFCQWAVYEADPDEAFRLVDLERQTLGQLLGYALENRQWTDARHLAVTLNRYWFNAGMAAEADAWVERARNALGVAGGNAPSPESPAGALWRTLLSSQATRLLNAGRTAEAASIRAEISPQPQPGSPQESMRDAADSHQHAGEIAQESGDWPDAEQRYRRSAELAEQLGDQGRVSRAATQLAVMLQKRGQWDDAERWYGRAVEAALQSGNDELLANAYHWRGTLAQDRKEWDQAERWYYRALAIREEANDKVGAARLFHQMGIVAQVRGQWNDAESWYRRALVILEETEQRIPLANTYTQLGMMDYQRGRLATAEDWYQRALEIASAAGNPSTIATLNHLLGAVAQQSGQWELAENRYTASLSALEEIGDDYHVALCARQLAVVARRNGRLGQAKAWADRVQHLAAVLGDGQLVAWSKRFALSLAED